ncbi:MAG: hypothetical protein HONBIEJF_00801 [Fimbriimonadaceae bacterium]|nr:hypothetical protein [Fimbriimonadaceae bacterium]
MIRSPWVWFAALFALIVIGCGGGGSGTGSTGGSTSLTTGGNNTGGTGGNTTQISGKVITSGTAIGIQGLVVTFHAADGSVIASATTQADGTFAANVPPNAVTFSIDPASFGSSYHKYFIYGTASYAPNFLNCRAPLPPLTVGQSISLPGGDIKVPLSIEPPPPPPTGCS